MPIIEFQNDGADGLRVLARMHFPAAETHRSRLLDDLLRYSGDGAVPHPDDTGSDAREGRHWGLTVSQTGWRGYLAGEGLRRLALLYERGDDEPSVRKVVRSLELFALELRTDPETGEVSNEREDRTIAMDKKSMWNYLREFKAVCHLWAAHRILEQTYPFLHFPVVLGDAKQLAKFLAHAEWFLEFGISHQSRNDKAGALLDRATAWLPSAPVKSSKPDLGEFPSSLQEAIANYRAH